MRRRRFLTTSASAVGVGLLGTASEAQRAGAGKQVLELRHYTFASASKLDAFESFSQSGLVPALNRAGIRPVGVFKMTRADNPQATFPGDTALELFVLLPHSSLESAATLDAKLAADAAYTSALAALGETPKDPAFARYENSLLLAFDQFPRVEVAAKSATRVLQLRTYEAANAERNRMTVRMFNEGGEIRIFREAGMTPVFFGHAFAGTKLPNLTYMLGFESDEALKAAWDKFGKHPDWLKLRNDPTYADTVSTITNLVLRPTGGSQI